MSPALLSLRSAIVSLWRKRLRRSSVIVTRYSNFGVSQHQIFVAPARDVIETIEPIEDGQLTGPPEVDEKLLAGLDAFD